MLAPSRSSVYWAMASRISLILMNSSAEWEREDSPGPSLKEGNDIKAWSLSVGLSLRNKTMVDFYIGVIKRYRKELLKLSTLIVADAWQVLNRSAKIWGGSGLIIYTWKHRGVWGRVAPMYWAMSRNSMSNANIIISEQRYTINVLLQKKMSGKLQENSKKVLLMLPLI